MKNMKKKIKKVGNMEKTMKAAMNGNPVPFGGFGDSFKDFRPIAYTNYTKKDGTLGYRMND